jgi:hypothetical protein
MGMIRYTDFGINRFERSYVERTAIRNLRIAVY